MTELEKLVSRRSKATRVEMSKRRAIIVTLEPSQKIGFRLEGTRDVFRLDIESGYDLAVRSHIVEVEKRTKELVRQGYKKRSASAKARKELKKLLKGYIREEVKA